MPTEKYTLEVKSFDEAFRYEPETAKTFSPLDNGSLKFWLSTENGGVHKRLIAKAIQAVLYRGKSPLPSMLARAISVPLRYAINPSS